MAVSSSTRAPGLGPAGWPGYRPGYLRARDRWPGVASGAVPALIVWLLRRRGGPAPPGSGRDADAKAAGQWPVLNGPGREADEAFLVGDGWRDAGRACGQPGVTHVPSAPDQGGDPGRSRARPPSWGGDS